VAEASVLSLFWKGFEVDRWEHLSPDALVITLKPSVVDPPACGRCGQHTTMIHDVSLRRVRERDVLSCRLWVDVPVRRVRCATCGPVTEHIGWLAPRSRLTKGMEAFIEALLRYLPIQHVAELVGLHWHTVRRIDYRRLEREVQPVDFRSVRRIIMDEFALYKGHRYATVAICADTQRVLWVGEGRTREAVRPFFEMMGEACLHIEAVAMDMNSALDLEVREHCPKAAVVYDLFHVIAKYGREVIDRVRVDQANALRHDKPARQIVKRSRWLLLRNRGNLSEGQAHALDELLAANRPLMTVYLLKAHLKDLWYAPSEEQARDRWRHWYRMAYESGLEPLIAFARRLAPYLDGIIASARFRLNTSVLEGMNNKIKVIKRMAYGYRDSAYFFLKIKAAFPGKVR
jgi:transposase